MHVVTSPIYREFFENNFTGSEELYFFTFLLNLFKNFGYTLPELYLVTKKPQKCSKVKPSALTNSKVCNFLFILDNPFESLVRTLLLIICLIKFRHFIDGLIFKLPDLFKS